MSSPEKKKQLISKLTEYLGAVDSKAIIGWIGQLFSTGSITAGNRKRFKTSRLRTKAVAAIERVEELTQEERDTLIGKVKEIINDDEPPASPTSSEMPTAPVKKEEESEPEPRTRSDHKAVKQQQQQQAQTRPLMTREQWIDTYKNKGIGHILLSFMYQVYSGKKLSRKDRTFVGDALGLSSTSLNSYLKELATEDNPDDVIKTIQSRQLKHRSIAKKLTPKAKAKVKVEEEPKEELIKVEVPAHPANTHPDIPTERQEIQPLRLTADQKAAQSEFAQNIRELETRRRPQLALLSNPIPRQAHTQSVASRSQPSFFLAFARFIKANRTHSDAQLIEHIRKTVMTQTDHVSLGLRSETDEEFGRIINILRNSSDDDLKEVSSSIQHNSPLNAANPFSDILSRIRDATTVDHSAPETITDMSETKVMRMRQRPPINPRHAAVIPVHEQQTIPRSVAAIPVPDFDRLTEGQREIITEHGEVRPSLSNRLLDNPIPSFEQLRDLQRDIVAERDRTSNEPRVSLSERLRENVIPAAIAGGSVALGAEMLYHQGGHGHPDHVPPPNQPPGEEPPNVPSKNENQPPREPDEPGYLPPTEEKDPRKNEIIAYLKQLVELQEAIPYTDPSGKYLATHTSLQFDGVVPKDVFQTDKEELSNKRQIKVYNDEKNSLLLPNDAFQRLSNREHRHRFSSLPLRKQIEETIARTTQKKEPVGHIEPAYDYRDSLSDVLPTRDKDNYRKAFHQQGRFVENARLYVQRVL